MLYEKLVENNLDWPYPILTDTCRTYTYAQLHQEVLELSERLEKRGGRPGQRAVIINGNTLETVFAILACIRSGMCFIMAPKEASEEHIQYILSDARPALLLDARRKGEVGMKETGMDSDGEELVYIIYTSGSTSVSKGVMAPEAQVLFCIETINDRLGNNQDDAILCCLPLSFDYGLYQLFFALSFRSRFVLQPGEVPQQIPQLLVNEKITAFPAMPALLAMLLRTGLLQRVAPLLQLRYISSTGDDFPTALIRRLKELLPQTEIIPMYGQTECKRVSIMPFGRLDKALAGSCGLPLKGTSVWLEDPDEEGVGELIVSGPHVMAGYMNADADSSAYFFLHPQYGRCLRTGDLFRMDEEGYLYFYGRKRRIIKVSGHRIGTVELERKLEEKMDGASRHLRVIGYPDELAGERILVCVSTDEDSGSVVEQLRAAVAEWPKYQRPTGAYIFSEAFPRSTNGKVDDALLLKEAIRNGTTAL